MPGEWAPHYNESDYGGQWRGVALRSATGSSCDLSAVPGCRTFADTDLLRRCPYIREALAVFRCPLKAVRLLSLAPHSFIREHSDGALEYEGGEIRIHIPIQTNAEVEFYVAGERLLLEVGRSYYVNVNLPHRVNNRGTSERVHLVIDAEVNEWVHALFRQGQAEGWNIARCALPPQGLDDFRKLVIEKEALQQRLRGIQDPDEFAQEVLRLAAELGFQLHEGDLSAGYRTACAAGEDGLKGWTPVRISFEPAPACEWLWTGSTRFTAPFFHDSIQECRRLPFARLFRRITPLDAALPADALRPAGFIFHMSRCGSTLVSRLLASLPRVSMMSEAGPLDDVLRTGNARWVRWVVAALGQRRTSEQSHFFLKLDAWHIRNLPLLRELFPDTPWIFLYRDPLEVVGSQLESPSLIGSPGMLEPRVLGLHPDDVLLGREQWCVRAIGGFLEAALSFQDDPNGRFIDYRDLPGAFFTEIARHFGLTVTSEEQSQLVELARFDAKRPGLWFDDDSRHKQEAAGEGVRQLARDALAPLYLQLQQLRKRGPA